MAHNFMSNEIREWRNVAGCKSHITRCENFWLIGKTIVVVKGCLKDTLFFITKTLDI